MTKKIAHLGIFFPFIFNFFSSTLLLMLKGAIFTSYFQILQKKIFKFPSNFSIDIKCQKNKHVGRELDVKYLGYKCGHFWQKGAGFRGLGSGHTVNILSNFV